MERRPLANAHSTIEHVDEDETKLCEVAKHPFGIFAVYAQAAVVTVLAVGLAAFTLPSAIDDTDQAFMLFLLLSGTVIVLAVLVVIMTTMVYRQNRLIVTDRNITQILQYGLFSRKVSQLNMVNVEDVTAVQSGFLSTIIGYGTLTIETAGEQANFKFTYCPRPGYYAKVILNAREAILGQHDGDSTVPAREVARM